MNESEAESRKPEVASSKGDDDEYECPYCGAGLSEETALGRGHCGESPGHMVERQPPAYQCAACRRTLGVVTETGILCRACGHEKPLAKPGATDGR